MKFNIGQEVAVIDIRSNCFGKKGMVKEKWFDRNTEIKLHDEKYNSLFENYQFAPANTIEGLVPGDVVVNTSGLERTVIERLPQSVLLSRSQILEGVFGWFTITELKNDGYSVKSANKEEPQTFPQIGDKFYFIRSRGYVTESTWTGSLRQRQLKEYGNVFKTEAEAEEALEKIKGVFKK